MFQRLSIRQKLTALLMTACAAVLLLASAAFVVWDFYQFRADMQADVITQARVVLENTEAAITFNDPDAAGATLEMLAIHPHSRLACLYLPGGRLFTSRVFRGASDECPAAPPDGAQFTPTRMLVTEQRELAGGPRLLIATDLDGHAARIRTQAAAVGAILVAGLLIAYVLSSLLGRLVARPIADIAGTARDIADRRDYSLRARQGSRDEIGVLAGTFNRMLDEIESSERRRADALERAQDANRLKDEFLATLSHELRTPLNAIVGWIHLLRSGQLPEEERRHAIERIDRNAHAQAKLVQDLLDVSRITTGKLHLDVREMDLGVVVANAIDACRPAADARQVAIVTQVGGAFPTCGDPDRLQQVVWNLVNNAVRFTPSGGRVLVSLARASGFDTLRVRDTGPGIEPQFLPFVFEPFRQAEAATTRAHGGLGIGLTIVRRLTEMHGGTVTAASDGAGLGATFTVTLPVRDGGATRSADAAPLRSTPLANAQVLVVDDDPDTLQLLQSALKFAGAVTRPATSVAEALHVLADGPPLDAIVSDIAMPGQDGYTLITLLKDRLGPAMPAATLALTAYAGAADRKRALDAGFREHLAKPVDPAVLVRTLEDLLAAGRG